MDEKTKIIKINDNKNYKNNKNYNTNINVVNINEGKDDADVSVLSPNEQELPNNSNKEGVLYTFSTI